MTSVDQNAHPVGEEVTVQPVAGVEEKPTTTEEPAPVTTEPFNDDSDANVKKLNNAEENDLLDGRRWYNQEGKYVTFQEFRETPMGIDSLNEPEDPEGVLKDRFLRFPTEEDHRKRGGHWDLQEMSDTDKPWRLLTVREKIETVVINFVKFCAVWGVLYLFIIALGIMGNAFQIVGGRSSGRTFRESELLSNPVAGLCIGIIATVLMQSSSTTTSIVISMAASDLVTIKNAAYLIMGANIGTSVTNTLVSIAHLSSESEYRRAFTGAVFHDVFNWLSVAMFLPLEASSGFLVELAGAAVDSLGISDDDEKKGKVDFIKKITKPAAGRFVSIDKNVIKDIAKAETAEELKKAENKNIIKQKSGHVLRDTPITENEAGVMLLFVSLTMLCVCLLLLVKLLQSLLKGRVAIWTRYLLNINFTHPILRSCGGLDNYILLFFGTGCTILVQSSSVFTSTLTPLVGIGLIHIEKATSLTHGANIGTTVTGVLSALSGSNVESGLRVALEHVFFNCLGTTIWFVIWPLRPTPLNIAKFLGDTAANLRWFPAAYILVCFVAFPLLVIALSIPGWEVFMGVMLPVALFLIFAAILVMLRRNRADLLPRSMPILRSETAPCGCRYPNFMQLWGGDIEQDKVDLLEMERKEQERKEREASVREWPYSPGSWGLSILAFLAVVLSIPTSQWRRVRYFKEQTGRKEVGFGLWEICSDDYKKDISYAVQPARDCNVELLRECASELLGSCTSDNWGNTEEWGKGEKLAYERAWTRCSQYGCRAFAFEESCKLLECHGNFHGDHCGAALDDYAFYHHVNQDKHGVNLSYEKAKEVVDTKPALSIEAFDETDDGSETFNGTTARTLAGIAFDPCTGLVHSVTSRGCNTQANFNAEYVKAKLGFSFPEANGSPKRSFEEDTVVTIGAADQMSTSELCDVNNEATAPTGIAAGDIDILDASKGEMIMVDQDSPKVVVFDAPQGATSVNVRATYVPFQSQTIANDDQKTYDILPSVFAGHAARRGLKALAVNADKTLAATCLSSSITTNPATADTDAARAFSRVVRCALLDLSNGVNNASVTAQKFIVLSDHGANQDQVEIVGASWYKELKVLLTERSGSSYRIIEADFSTGTNLTAENYESSLDLEDMAMSNGVSVVDATRVLFAKAMEPVSTKYVMTVPKGLSVSGLAIVNEFTIAVTEEATASTGSNVAVHLLQTPIELEKFEEAGCPKAKADREKFAKGDKCRSISEICPEGGLASDMEVVAGLIITGSVFLGLGTVMITMYALWPHSSIFGKMLYPSAVCLVLAWIFILGAWAHMATLEDNEYSCYFIDEALTKGFVLHTAKLKHLTMQSYSWAFAIVSWGFVTMACGFVIHRCVSLRLNPNHAKDINDAAEVAAEAEEGA